MPDDMQFIFQQTGSEPVYGNEIDIVRHMRDLFGWQEWNDAVHDALLAMKVGKQLKHEDLSITITRWL